MNDFLQELKQKQMQIEQSQMQSDIIEIFFIFLLIMLIFLFIIYWITQFLELMSFKDSQFIGKNDKVLWFIFFLIIPILAPFVYKYFRQKYYTSN